MAPNAAWAIIIADLDRALFRSLNQPADIRKKAKEIVMHKLLSPMA
jgi:hypothetical protein